MGQHHSHFTYSERVTLERCIQQNFKMSLIAFMLNKSERAIRLEKNRGYTFIKVKDNDVRVYSPEKAQRLADENKKHHQHDLKIGNDIELSNRIEKEIVENKLSPVAVVEILKREAKYSVLICAKTIYNYIAKGLFVNLTNKHLPCEGKRKRKHDRIVRPAHNNAGTSIEERPKHILERKEFGHWEIDCVIGKKEKDEVLLTIAERSNRAYIIRKMKDKTQESVINEINKLELELGNKFKEVFKTITADNGTEFLNFFGIEKSVISKEPRTKVYYAHPYCSYERGTNEVTNKLLRRWIPKGHAISNYTKEFIYSVQEKINNYPRKILGYKTANDLLKDLGLQF